MSLACGLGNDSVWLAESPVAVGPPTVSSPYSQFVTLRSMHVFALRVCVRYNIMDAFPYSK